VRGDERLSFATCGSGAGLTWSIEARTEEETRRYLKDLFERPGPALLSVRLEDEPCAPVAAGPWSQVEKRTMFMHALAALDSQ